MNLTNTPKKTVFGNLFLLLFTKFIKLKLENCLNN